MSTTSTSTHSRFIRLAVTTALATTVLAGCTGKAAPSANYSAAQAEASLGKGKTVKAIELAENAVLAAPRDAATRTLLANSYLGAGRFQSAATTFGEAIELGDTAPRTVVSYALALTAVGDHLGAQDVLRRFEAAIDPADFGLAIALAGLPQEGVHVLGNALRNGNNSAKVRQNLAYALAMTGDWKSARIMVAEDVPADQVGERLAQWAQMAQPEHNTARVARLIGVTPALDGGQPAMLALANHPAVEMLAAESAVQAVPAPVADAPAPAFAMAGEFPAAEPAPVGFDSAFADAGAAGFADAGPARAAADARFVASPTVQAVPAPRAAPAPRKAVRTAAAVPAARAPLAKGDYNVQLGAYNSLADAQDAWKRFQVRYPDLSEAERVITKARVNGKIYYRVAAAGFAAGSARALCSTVKGKGGGCIAYASSRPLPGAINDKVRVAAR